MSDNIEGLTHLLAFHLSDLIRAMCRLPDDAVADDAHVRHVETIAGRIVRTQEMYGYWTPETEAALQRVKATREALWARGK